MQLSQGSVFTIQSTAGRHYYKAVYCCFYDCSVANTTVIGKAADVAFKTTGNFTKGWRIVLRIPTQRKRSDLLPTLSKAKRTTTLVLEKTKAQISSQRRPYYGHGNRRKTGGR
jgi:hypothetical protein